MKWYIFKIKNNGYYKLEWVINDLKTYKGVKNRIEKSVFLKECKKDKYNSYMIVRHTSDRLHSSELIYNNAIVNNNRIEYI